MKFIKHILNIWLPVCINLTPKYKARRLSRIEVNAVVDRITRVGQTEDNG